VRRWITAWLWDDAAKEDHETIVAFDADSNAPVGYATWRHREADLPNGQSERAIEIEWFGVDVNYQHQRTDDDESIANKIFVTVEQRARSHEQSTQDMPLILEVDADNIGAQGFWEHLGFEFFEWAAVGDDRYLRMIRSASEA
jgi:ribosomal protein S18 acetylase RimI-like enzyme